MKAALADYETTRREEVEKTQHSANVSLVWFEHVKRFWNMDPTRFIFGLMTRSKAITYDNLALRAPGIVEDMDHLVADETKANGFDVDTRTPVPPMFQPLQLRGMTVPNRVVVSPMCQYSAKDGLPNDWHLVHLGSRAIGGAGLVFTEMTDVSAEARISHGCTGLYNEEQEAAWKRIVDFVHANSAAKICMQLGHAGRKGATKLSWEGNDEPLESGAWPIVSASPLPYFPNSQVPREMTRADMDKTIADYVAAVKRAERAGFDMIELHAAHGYLIASFISPITNKRNDEYGGSLENRMRFPLEVFRAMRKAWPDDKPMSVRISATDWIDGGVTGDDAVQIARMFEDAGCDLIDVSTGQTVAGILADLRPHVSDAVLRPDQERGRHRDHGGRRHHHRRSGQHHRRGRARRSGRACASASDGPVLHHAVRGLVRRRQHRLPAAISVRPRPNFPQLRARARGDDRTQAQGQAEAADRYLETGGGIALPLVVVVNTSINIKRRARLRSC